MSQRRKASPLMGAAQAMLDGVSDSLVRQESRFMHSMEVGVDKVRPDPGQPRKVFDTGELGDLAKTMAEQGQLQPILVRRDGEARGQWIIVAGERRWRAAEVNGWKTILAIEHVGDPEVATLVENLQRVDLNAVEEARGLRRLLQQKGWSQARAAQALGKAAPEISSVLRILTLPDGLLEELLATKDSAPSRYVLAELARVKEGPVRERLISAARDGNLTQRMIRNAREEAERATAPDVPAVPPGEASLSPRAIQSLRNRIREVRESLRPLSPEERSSLERLRLEISTVLDMVGGR